MQFQCSSIREVGSLLGTLAASRPNGRLAEIGTGTGVGAAWIASAMGPEASFVTVEVDDDRAAACAELFTGLPNVRVLHGDWHDVLPPEAPFDLLFFDGGGWKRSPPQQMRAESERALKLVASGGIVTMDNLTPEHLLPADGPSWPDALREFWLGSDGLVATEVLTTPDSAALVAVKR
ncbi:MAG TPA: class I SAM-dependent methyltransferase [Gaiellaceae bacterium]|nr:class I SAM-dependent methyltransferase [Gaiellaceae bacterium]